MSAALATAAPPVADMPVGRRAARPAPDFRRTDSADIASLRERADPELRAARDVWEAMDRLARAVSRAPDRPLPERERLEAAFDTSLARFTAVWSQEIAGLLSRLGAGAAVMRDRMVLPRPDVDFETLRHETAHLLQTPVPSGPTPEPDTRVEPDIATAEAEAEHAESHDGDIVGERPSDAILFRALADIDDPDAWRERQSYRARLRAEAAADDEAPGSPSETEAPGVSPEEQANDNEVQTESPDLAEATLGAPVLDEPDPVAEPPPKPALGGIDAELQDELDGAEAEAAAAREAALAALAAATTPEGYMDAYSGAPPSLKAELADGLSARLDALAAEDSEAFRADMPEPVARLSGAEGDLPPVDPVSAPGGTLGPLEAEPPGPTPEPEIASLPAPEPVETSLMVAASRAALGRVSERETADAERVAASIAALPVTDGGVRTSVPVPTVTLGGESDPERLSEQGQAAEARARDATRGAMQSILQGPGPERVQLRAFEEAVPVELAPAEFASPEMEVGSGPAEYRDYPIDERTQAVFDAAHSDSMQASFETAREQTQAMAEERDLRRDTALADAEAGIAEAGSQADAKQVDAVARARADIQDGRQEGLDRQAAELAAVETRVEARMTSDADAITTRVNDDNAKLATEYAAAEAEAEAEVAKSEAKARAEREKAEAAAEEEGWWGRTTRWLGEQLDAVGALIGKVFDALKESVFAIFDAVEKIAHTVIDATAEFAKGVISLGGEFLKLQVTALLGSTFPEVAAFVNGKIDEGVARAHAAVDVIAQDLKDAVSAVVDVLKKAAAAVIDFVSKTLQYIVKVASAVVRGDWSEVARLVIDPILEFFGIDPAEFYGWLRNAMDSLGKILSDAGEFLGNLFDAVVLGFQRFSDNIGDHLIKGVIGWLTGAMGGTLTIPERFDILGLLDLARQILNLTLDRLRDIAVQTLGRERVERIEMFVSYAAELVSGGWGAFFALIMKDLTGVVDTVLEEIVAYVTERITREAVLWLVSALIPGAVIIKVIKMIWDFIVWVRDNLDRLKSVVQSVKDTMSDIAAGNLEPAAKGVETALGNLLAPAIDLMARLAGLGNVTKPVKKIIGGIRERIRKAVAKLVKRVFGGKGKGKGKTSDKGKTVPDAKGSIMSPMSFGTGKHAHTLYFGKERRGVEVMMRSTPQAVEDWLAALKTNEGVEAQLKLGGKIGADMKPEAVEALVKSTRAVTDKLVDIALSKEKVADKEGDEAATASAAVTNGKGRKKGKGSTKAQKEAEQARAAAKALRTPLDKIANALGVIGKNKPFREHFAKEVSRLDASVRKRAAYAFKKIEDEPGRNHIYTSLDWPSAIMKIGDDPEILTQPMRDPFGKAGILIGDDPLVSMLIDDAVAMTRTNDNYKSITRTMIEHGRHGTGASWTKSWMRALSQHTVSPKIVKNAVYYWLSGDRGATTNFARTLHGEVSLAMATYVDGFMDAPDKLFKSTISGNSFKVGGHFWSTQKLRSASIEAFAGPDQDISLGKKPVWYFLDPERGKPNRVGLNRDHAKDSVRGAAPGQHEWMPTSHVVEAMKATIDQLKSRDEGHLDQVTNLLRFQHLVRTDTSDIIFSAKWTEKHKTTEGYRIKALSHKFYKKLLADAVPKQTSGGKQYTHEIGKGILKRMHRFLSFAKSEPAYQAHAGGLYARQIKEIDGIGHVLYDKQANSVQNTWHKEIFTRSEKVIKDIGKGGAGLKDLGAFVLEYYEATSLHGASREVGEASLGQTFGLYKFSERKSLPLIEYELIEAELAASGASELDEAARRRVNKRVRERLQDQIWERRYKSEVRDRDAFLDEASKRYTFAIDDLRAKIAKAIDVSVV